MTQNQDLRAELLRRAERDQAARRASRGADFWPVHRVDAENLPWLKQVVADIGWPGASAVGEDGAHAAWLLVQHAAADPKFQRRCPPKPSVLTCPECGGPVEFSVPEQGRQAAVACAGCGWTTQISVISTPST
jgi:hypothetical protein